METTKEICIENLQNRILNILGEIHFSERIKEDFLSIIGVLYGRQHKTYEYFKEFITDQSKQREMIFAPRQHKLRKDFKVCCHRLLINYIEQVSKKIENPEGPKERIPEQDILLEHYFEEVEKTSQYKSRLLSFDKNNFPELRDLEYSLIRRLLPNEKDNLLIPVEFTAANYRQILTIWLVYPKMMYYLDDIDKILSLFETAQLQVSKN